MRSLVVAPTSPPTRLSARLRGLAQDQAPALRVSMTVSILLGVTAGAALAYATTGARMRQRS